MKSLMTILAVCVCGMAAGCSGPKPPEETLPSVTMVTREPAENMIAMTFVFKDMDRANWKNRVLKAAIVKSGEMPPAGVPEFKDPPRDFAVQVIVANSGIETVYFTPSWGPASEGKFLVNGTQLTLPAPDGKTNEVTLAGYAEHRISQVVEAWGGPGRPRIFDPGKGVDLITVGYPPDAYCLRVWADKPSEQ